LKHTNQYISDDHEAKLEVLKRINFRGTTDQMRRVLEKEIDRLYGLAQMIGGVKPERVVENTTPDLFLDHRSASKALDT